MLFRSLTNHLVLNVSDLPSDDNPAGNWYLDVGLGDTLYDPLPLRPQAHRQGPFDIALESTPGGVGDWHLTHDPQGSFSAWRGSRFRPRCARSMIDIVGFPHRPNPDL